MSEVKAKPEKLFSDSIEEPSIDQSIKLSDVHPKPNQPIFRYSDSQQIGFRANRLKTYKRRQSLLDSSQHQSHCDTQSPAVHLVTQYFNLPKSGFTKHFQCKMRSSHNYHL